jgi:hypothetical protein
MYSKVSEVYIWPRGLNEGQKYKRITLIPVTMGFFPSEDKSWFPKLTEEFMQWQFIFWKILGCVLEIQNAFFILGVKCWCLQNDPNKGFTFHKVIKSYFENLENTWPVVHSRCFFTPGGEIEDKHYIFLLSLVSKYHLSFYVKPESSRIYFGMRPKIAYIHREKTSFNNIWR